MCIMTWNGWVITKYVTLNLETNEIIAVWLSEVITKMRLFCAQRKQHLTWKWLILQILFFLFLNASCSKIKVSGWINVILIAAINIARDVMHFEAVVQVPDLPVWRPSVLPQSLAGYVSQKCQSLIKNN